MAGNGPSKPARLEAGALRRYRYQIKHGMNDGEDYISKPTSPINASDCAKYVEEAKASERAIPPGLSFEEVINDKPLPPCSLNDFMDYLVYIEHNAENLQFYLWYQDYVQRWNALPANQRALSPELRPDQADFPNLTRENGTSREGKMPSARPKMRSEGWTANGKSFLFDDQDANDDEASFVSFERSTTPNDGDIAAQAGLKWKPFTIQPNREECDQIVRHYLALHSSRELNLSHRDRVLVLHALQHTTHPSAFAPALKVAEATLRSQSHRNFIRWSICNGNKPRILAVQYLGISSIAAGVTIACLLTLSHASRWYRIFAAVPWFIGFATIVASYKGLCIILHHSHKRNLRPWELDRMDPQQSMAYDRRNSYASVEGGRIIKLSSKTPSYEDSRVEDVENERGRGFTPTSMETFGPKNSWEQERWVSGYEKTPLLTKIFHEKCVWTQDETLRVLQDQIVLGAHLWGIIITVPLTAAFVAIPKGNAF